MNGRALLAWNLRRLRAERGIAQERLAHDAGVDRAYLSKLERAQANPSLDVLERLIEPLESELTDLFRTPEPGAKCPQSLRSGPRKGSRR
jgi:transcriptional regulator with XRE-family HTH domain